MIGLGQTEGKDFLALFPKNIASQYLMKEAFCTV